MKPYAIFITAAFLIVCFLWWDREQSHNYELGSVTKEKEFHKSFADSIAAYYRQRLEEDSIILASYGNAVQRANNAEQLALKLQKDLRYERSLNRRFNDAQSDSLIAEIR